MLSEPLNLFWKYDLRLNIPPVVSKYPPNSVHSLEPESFTDSVI